MRDLLSEAIEASKPRFVPITAEAPVTLAWYDATLSIWLVAPPQPDGALTLVYDVGQAQN